MLLTADVNKLKCIYYGIIESLVNVDWYGLKCNTDTLNKDLETVSLYTDLIEISPTVCRSLECKILEFIETKISYCETCVDDCNRNSSVSVAPTLVLTGPSNMTVSIEPPATHAVVNFFGNFSYVTNCDYGITLNQIVGLSPGSSFPIGVNTITYRATNACGLTSDYTFTITVALAS